MMVVWVRIFSPSEPLSWHESTVNHRILSAAPCSASNRHLWVWSDRYLPLCKHAGWRLSPGPSSPCASWETSSTATRPKPPNCLTWTSRLSRSSTRTRRWSRSSVCRSEHNPPKTSDRVVLDVFLTLVFFPTLPFQPRSMMPSWPPSLWSSRSHVSWVLVWIRPASSPPCSPTTRTWTPRWTRSNPPSNSRWRRYVHRYLKFKMVYSSTSTVNLQASVLQDCRDSRPHGKYLLQLKHLLTQFVDFVMTQLPGRRTIHRCQPITFNWNANISCLFYLSESMSDLCLFL